MELIPYSPIWRSKIEEVFLLSVLSCYEYTESERKAWASSVYTSSFHERWTRTDTVLAVEEGELLGFGNIDRNYIDTLFVAPKYQKRGVGSAILAVLEGKGAFPLSVYASRTAYPFFLSHGYMKIRENIVERNGEKLVNYLLCKPINLENK